jgi:HEPN domain-containing protein
MKTDENNPNDWLRSARNRLRSADILYENEGVGEAGIELIQEAAERALKAYLIAKGWELRRVHDLGALIADAVGLDGRFRGFEDAADSLTDQFWAQHYPGGDIGGVGHDYPEIREVLGRLFELVERELGDDDE